MARSSRRRKRRRRRRKRGPFCHEACSEEDQQQSPVAFLHRGKGKPRLSCARVLLIPLLLNLPLWLGGSSSAHSESVILGVQGGGGGGG
jgi:hypothetical protein